MTRLDTSKETVQPTAYLRGVLDKLPPTLLWLGVVSSVGNILMVVSIMYYVKYPDKITMTGIVYIRNEGVILSIPINANDEHDTKRWESVRLTVKEPHRKDELSGPISFNGMRLITPGNRMEIPIPSYDAMKLRQRLQSSDTLHVDVAITTVPVSLSRKIWQQIKMH